MLLSRSVRDLMALPVMTLLKPYTELHPALIPAGEGLRVSEWQKLFLKALQLSFLN